MIPTGLTPDVLHYAEILIAGLPTTAPSSPLLVCAWCTPRVELEQLNRAHPGQISHGICATCVEVLIAQETPVPSARYEDTNVRERWCAPCRRWFRVHEDHDVCPTCQTDGARA